MTEKSKQNTEDIIPYSMKLFYAQIELYIARQLLFECLHKLNSLGNCTSLRKKIEDFLLPF